MARPVDSSNTSNATWTSGQAYALALICLAVGLVLGYLFRGSSSPAPTAASAPTGAQMPASGQMPGPAALPGSMAGAPRLSPQEAEQQAQPLLASLNSNPNDVQLLTQVGNIYYDSNQFPKAVEYYGRALKVHPEDVNVRTDMGTAYWYMGDADRALAEFEKSLSYQPTYPQTLFNMGMVKWQGKKDPKGAVEAWEKLLKNNPNYPERDKVETMIAQAKQHASR